MVSKSSNLIMSSFFIIQPTTTDSLIIPFQSQLYIYMNIEKQELGYYILMEVDRMTGEI